MIRLALDQGSFYRFEKRSDLLLHVRHSKVGVWICWAAD